MWKLGDVKKNVSVSQRIDQGALSLFGHVEKNGR